jgi:uncharacterized protein YhbP (UPF0306 family)
MKAPDLLKQYLQERHMMQLATMAGDQPWCCTVYFLADDQLNLYWASLPTRRHSQEIVSHNKVAAAIPVKFVNGEKVVGIQVEGTAEEISPSASIRDITKQYATKFHRDDAWVEDFISGITEHRLYKLTPALFVLFDEQNFPTNTRIEISP